ncbi:MAG: Fic family protein [archaeon]|nr:Fic family protein [archaeon]
MFGFRKRKSNLFPSDSRGRRETIMSIHRYVAHDDLMRDGDTIDLLLELISDESDPFLRSAYVIYYIGSYKPFVNGNEETARRIADLILADDGWTIPQTSCFLNMFQRACANSYDIEEIGRWEKANAERLVR